jgi:hypothetical protein
MRAPTRAPRGSQAGRGQGVRHNLEPEFAQHSRRPTRAACHQTVPAGGVRRPAPADYLQKQAGRVVGWMGEKRQFLTVCPSCTGML